jgi:CRISPR/Cas system-associated exonuclease Cas4 (RecB family)
MQKALSFTTFSLYGKCPLRYRLKRDKVKPVKPVDEYNTVYGSVLQKVLEHFYNDEIWKRGKEVRSILKDITPPVFYKIIRVKSILWGDHDVGKDALLQECIDSVDPLVDMVKRYELLGEYAKSEVPVPCYVSNTQQIYGRIDFVIKRKGLLYILDGKSSKSKDKYLDKNQLLWYALSYYLLYKKMPDHLQYWFYRFPDDAIKDVPFTVDQLKTLKEEILDVIESIARHKFKATPSSDACFFCEYKDECKDKADSTNKSVLSKDSKPGVQDLDI